MNIKTSKLQTAAFSLIEALITISLIDPQDKTALRTVTLDVSATSPGARLFYGTVDKGRDIIALDDEMVRALSMPLQRLIQKY